MNGSYPKTIAVETLAGGATAFRAASLSTSAAFQHQKLTHTERGNSWGLCAPIPAVVYDNVRDWSAIGRAGLPGADAPNLLTNWRGLCAPSFSRNSHRSAFSPDRRLVRCSSRRTGHHLPGCAVMAAPGAFIHASGPDCSPPRANRLPHQQLVNPLVDRLHFPNVLSNSFAFAGFNTSEAANGRAQNSVGAFQKRQGGYPHVGS